MNTQVTTQISTKLAALGVALMMNSLMIGGIAYLFNAELHQHVPVSLAEVSAPVQGTTV